MNAPSIQTIISSGQPNLWDYLAKLPMSMEAQVLYALLFSGAAGMAAHYAVRWARGEVTGGLATYLFVDYAKRTVLALLLLTGMATAAIASNIFTTDTGAFVGWLNVLWFGVTNGYASDSMANKGDTK